MKLHMHTRTHARTTPRGRGPNFLNWIASSFSNVGSQSKMRAMYDHQLFWSKFKTLNPNNASKPEWNCIWDQRRVICSIFATHSNLEAMYDHKSLWNILKTLSPNYIAKPDSNSFLCKQRVARTYIYICLCLDRREDHHRWHVFQFIFSVCWACSVDAHYVERETHTRTHANNAKNERNTHHSNPFPLKCGS
jgi:hypothetical protein